MVLHYFDFSFDLEHWHFETFAGEEETIGLEIKPTFETDSEGRIVALREKVEVALPAIRFAKKAADKLSDPDFLDTLVGTYSFSEANSMEVSRKGKRLFASLPGQPDYELVPLQGIEFSLKQLDGFSMEFIEEDGKIVAVVSHQPNGNFRAERK